VKPAIPRTTTLTRALIPAMQSGTAYAHFFAGCYDEASVWAAKALHEFPSFLAAARVAAASTMLPVGANVCKVFLGDGIIAAADRGSGADRLLAQQAAVSAYARPARQS
jgi:hypothetical protein